MSQYLSKEYKKEKKRDDVITIDLFNKIKTATRITGEIPPENKICCVLHNFSLCLLFNIFTTTRTTKMTKKR
jgi:hypothetical protein